MVSLSFFWLNETLVRKYTNVEYFTLAKINLKKAKTHQLTVPNPQFERVQRNGGASHGDLDLTVENAATSFRSRITTVKL